jgi:hypothetical protein
MNHTNLTTSEQAAAADTISDIDQDVQAKKEPDLQKDHRESYCQQNR